MPDEQHLETGQDRKITWSLIAIVIIFVIAMSGIVLWITSSLIKNENGGAVQPVSPTPLVSGTPTRHSPTPTDTLKGSEVPGLVDATWTPASRSKGFVKFVLYYVKPSRVAVGECVQITWETENAVSLQLYRNGELILDPALTSQTFQDCPNEVGYAVYRLQGENSSGQSNWIELQVKVQPAP